MIEESSSLLRLRESFHKHTQHTCVAVKTWGVEGGPDPWNIWDIKSYVANRVALKCPHLCSEIIFGTLKKNL